MWLGFAQRISRLSQVCLFCFTGVFGLMGVARADSPQQTPRPLPLPPPAMATQTRNYMILFGSQDGRDSIPNSHTFATFVQVTGDPTHWQDAQIYADTISWLPADLDICLFCGPKIGVDLSLEQTLNVVAAAGESTIFWGPFEITPDLYARALERIRFLHSGAAFYKVLDKNSRVATYYGQPGGALDCIHAVSDLGGYLMTGSMRGFEASEAVLHELRPWILGGPQGNEWLLARLGVTH